MTKILEGMKTERPSRGISHIDVGHEELVDDVPADSVRLYLNRIAKVALLSAEEEVELSKMIEAGLYAQKIIEVLENGRNDEDELFAGKYSTDDLTDLRTISDQGNSAKTQMIESNLRLVVSLAKSCIKQDGSGLPLLDMVQEGNIGLMHAVEKFDYQKGYKFSTYASWWIKQSIARAITNKSRLIRIPEKSNNILKKILVTHQDLKEALGREVTIDEVAEDMRVTVDIVNDLLVAAQTPLSLNETISGGDSELVELIASDQNTESVVHNIAFSDISKEFDRVLRDHLTETEYKVIKLRFGLTGREPISLTDTAEKVGHCRQHVSKVEQSALKKLKSIALLEELQRNIYE